MDGTVFGSRAPPTSPGKSNHLRKRRVGFTLWDSRRLARLVSSVLTNRVVTSSPDLPPTTALRDYEIFLFRRRPLMGSTAETHYPTTSQQPFFLRSTCFLLVEVKRIRPVPSFGIEARVRKWPIRLCKLLRKASTVFLALGSAIGKIRQSQQLMCSYARNGLRIILRRASGPKPLL